MSHQSQIDFVAGVKNRFPDYFTDKKVLEIGSLDINGSIRTFLILLAILALTLERVVELTL